MTTTDADAPVPRGVTVLAHVVFGLEALGVVLTIVWDAPHDTSLTGWRAPLLLFAALVVVVGWILAWKRPRIPIGWLLLGIGFMGSLQGPAAAIAVANRTANPRLAGWAVTFGSQSSWTWIPALGILLVLIPLRFPDGTLPSRRWTWFWWFSIATLVGSVALAATFVRSMEFGVPNPTYVHWGRALGLVQLSCIIPIVIVMVGALASLFVRYRRADAVTRAQLRWLFWALAIAAGLLIVGGIENAIFGNEDSKDPVVSLVAHIIDFLNTITYSLIPLAILIAVLRSGLYTIDRIVSRTAAYAVVTVTIVVVYAGIVILGSLLIPDNQAIGVALATLAAAALFLPLLRVVRRRVDRRFNRAQYDAEKVVDAFGERIRTGADPQAAANDVIAAVQQALQPTAIGIWRKEPS